MNDLHHNTKKDDIINSQLSIVNHLSLFGLLGYPLSHSFSKGWFEQRGYRYRNFEYSTVEEFLSAIPTDLEGFNVTIPHKQSILPYLSRVDQAALEVGAVNCVKITDQGLVGYNTDVVGFEQNLTPLLTTHHRRAAILGSGGASLAVQYVMRRLGIDYEVVSRSDGGYDRFDPSRFQIIINATPVGMFPNIDQSPAIDYSAIDDRMICYDLIYNPAQSQFLHRCRCRGAVVVNGLTMLQGQAQAALEIFIQSEDA